MLTQTAPRFTLAPTADPASVAESPAAILARLAVPALPAHICNHEPAAIMSYETGGFFMAGGEPTDNIETVYFCRACGADFGAHDPRPAPVFAALIDLPL